MAPTVAVRGAAPKDDPSAAGVAEYATGAIEVTTGAAGAVGTATAVASGSEDVATGAAGGAAAAEP
jgi:hypothetical protein